VARDLNIVVLWYGNMPPVHAIRYDEQEVLLVRFRTLAITSFILSLMLVVAACNGADDDTVEPAATDDAVEDVLGEPAPERRAGLGRSPAGADTPAEGSRRFPPSAA
jgi:hypothetical protein